MTHPEDAARQAADRAVAEVDRLFDEHIRLLVDLVRCRSTLGLVRPAQEILYRHLRQLGADARLYDINGEELVSHPDYAPVDWSSTGQPNVLGVLQPTIPAEDGRSLVLNGHIDVVPSGPVDWWTYDPWDGTIVGDRMYGRGALDMKSGLVAGLLAMKAVQAAGIERRGPVIFESVIEEECTGNGMLASRLQTGRIDGAAILEPTNLETWTATPGVVWFEVTVYGRPAYVGRGSEYVNAIEVASALIGRMKPRAVEDLNASFNHPAFAGMERPLNLSVGKISGGDWPSSIPLECTFTCRMSYPIDWSFADARAFVERQVREAAAEDPWLAQCPPKVRFPGFRARGWSAQEDSGLLKALSVSHAAVVGSPLKRTVFPGTADARYFDPGAGEEATYYGPTGGNIHAPDEYVELESIRQVARVVARLIVEWCG